MALIRTSLVLLLLAACTTPAPSCRVGPLTQMNVGQWQPTEADMTLR